MNVSCLIFDDELAALSEVSFLVGKYAPDWKILGIASTIENCKKMLQAHPKVNVIFTDIHFGNQLIFELLPDLKNFKGDIIFISGDNSFASQAFQLSAVDYLLKPVNENLFLQTLQKYNISGMERPASLVSDVLYHNMKEKHAPLKKISFNTTAGYVIKELNQIIYAKAQSNYTEFYFNTNEKILVTKTMLDYEKMLEHYGFFRIHQSYLVNFDAVEKFNSDDLQLYLTNKEVLPVSNRKKTLLLDTLKKVF